MKFTVKINSILHAPLPSHVNVVNLQRMADHIRTVSQEMFGMSFYRADDDFFRHECNSVGCIIGHCRQARGYYQAI